MGLECRQRVIGLDYLRSQIDGTQERLGLPSDSIDVLVLRMGEFKAQWQIGLVDDGVKVMRGESLWNEDQFKGSISPVRSAVLKSCAPREAVTGLIRDQNKWVVNYGLDVVLTDSSGRDINKPRHANSKLEIERVLNSGLGGNRSHEFKVKVGMALFGTNDLNPDGLGLSLYEDHKFVVEPLSPAEIELYVYGLVGRYGERHVLYLQELYDSLTAKYDLSEEQRMKLAEGFSLEELKMTNMACYWPYVNLQSHISEVDGVKRGEVGFDDAVTKLLLSLIGRPSDSAAFITAFSHLPLVDDVGSEANLYPDLCGKWQQVMVVNGQPFSITRITEQDIESVSAMAAKNFNDAPNYAYLTTDEKRLYTVANCPSGVWETSSHPDNISSLVIKRLNDGRDEIVGWQVIRKVPGNPGLAEIRRVHVDFEAQGYGLGKRMLAIGESLMRDAGKVACIIHASGDSASFFEARGYQALGKLEECNGVFGPEGQPKPDKVRLIKYL